MFLRFTATLILTLTAAVAICAAGEADPADHSSIRITETGKTYVVTVPASRLVMTIPSGDLTRAEHQEGEAAGSPRYFLFRHKTLNLTVEGWFEPAERFPGLKKLWEEKTNVFARTGRPLPEEVSFVKIGKWRAITYVIPDPALPLITFEISAHWLQAGTWIELRLSITAAQMDKESRTKVMDVLKTIQVNEKK